MIAQILYCRIQEQNLWDALLEQGIARFKLPERLEILVQLPLSPFGKVSKKTLGEMIAEKLAREAEG